MHVNRRRVGSYMKESSQREYSCRVECRMYRECRESVRVICFYALWAKDGDDSARSKVPNEREGWLAGVRILVVRVWVRLRLCICSRRSRCSRVVLSLSTRRTCTGTGRTLLFARFLSHTQNRHTGIQAYRHTDILDSVWFWLSGWAAQTLTTLSDDCLRSNTFLWKWWKGEFVFRTTILFLC